MQNRKKISKISNFCIFYKIFEYFRTTFHAEPEFPFSSRINELLEEFSIKTFTARGRLNQKIFSALKCEIRIQHEKLF